MGASCVITPKKGAKTFNTLKEQFGREQAAIIFNNVQTKEFTKAYKDSLNFDTEGIPTYNSIINNAAVLEYLGMDTIIQALNKSNKEYEDTVENVKYLIQRAILFNKESEHYVQYVVKNKAGNLIIETAPKIKQFEDIAKYQAKINALNEFVSDSLLLAGVTLGFLNSEQTAIGRVGLTDFSHAQNIANNFAGLIGIANNLEGFKAESEEFSHLLVRLYKNQPLVSRSLKFLTNYNNAVKMFGAQEVDSLLNYYKNNMDLVAEELVGRLLQLRLINNIDTLKLLENTPIIKRAFNKILSFFKGLNPFSFRETVESISEYMDDFSKKVINKEVTVKPKKIVKIEDTVHFNALSGRALELKKALDKIVTTLLKSTNLLKEFDDLEEGDMTERQKNYEVVNRIKSIMHQNLDNNKEESMKAISEILDRLLVEVKNSIKNLNTLESLSQKDLAILLYNTIVKLQSNSSILKEIRLVLTEEFLSDEDINSQKYVYSDTIPMTNETFEEEEKINTSAMTTKEIIETIEQESLKFKLSEDGKYYLKEGVNYERTTTIINFDASAVGEEFKSSNPWYTPSTNIGTTMDEIVRDFFSGRIIKKDENYVIEDTDVYNVYPNVGKEAIKNFILLLEAFKKDLDSKGIKIVPRDVTVSGTVGIIDMLGITHNIRVAGTLDLLGVDKNGNWHVFDMKTHRGDKIKGEKLKRYQRLLTLYKTLLQEKYGIKVTSLNIIPIKVTYPSPVEANNPMKYKQSTSSKHSLYNGKENNQLILNGEEFRGSKPVLQKTILIGLRHLNLSYSKYSGDNLGGLSEGKAIVLNLLRELTQDLVALKDAFMKKSKTHIIEFAKQFVGEQVETTDKNGNIVKSDIEEVLFRSYGDIDLMSKLFLTHSRMKNTTLQIFNNIIRQQKAKKRLKVIELSLRIRALGKKYEDMGITSYEWMYSADRRSYIIHTFSEEGILVDYDSTAYNEAKKVAYTEIETLYSEDTKKILELKLKWLLENSLLVTINGRKIRVPKHSKYPSKYDSLNEKQKEFYNEWMKIKLELDFLLPNGKTTLFNTIKIRKNGMERLKNTVKGKGVSEFLNALKDLYLKSYEDLVSRELIVLKDFLGEEKLNLPIYYVGNNKDTDYSDISLDAIGTLIAYADMACNYESMDEIINSLEVSKYVIQHTHDLVAPNKKESYRTKEGVVESEVFLNTTKSLFMDAFSNMLKLKVYERINSSYNKEEGKVDTHKIANFLLKLGSYTLLGFNLMANTANLLTGIATINIEMSAGLYFNRKELANADKTFMLALGDYVGDIGLRIPTSKLALYLELLNVRLNFSMKKRNTDFLSKTILGLIFGPHLLFVGLEAGDLWLYSRVAIAMGTHEKIYDSKNGNKKISVWDALEKVPINESDPSLGYKLIIKDGIVKEDGSNFTLDDLNNHATTITNVNLRLFGNYNDDDLILARTYILGRFIMQYRDFLPTAFMMRFLTRRPSIEEGNLYEGMYISMGKLFLGMYKDLRRGEFNLTSAYDKLELDLKLNIRRTLTEIIQWLGIVGLGMLLRGDGEDKRNKSWFRKYIEYMVTREETELGALIPGPGFKELKTIVNSPIANTNTMQSIWNLKNLLWVPDYFTEIESGKYRGHTEAYRTFIKSPLSLWYRNIDRLMNPDDAATFYNRE